MFLGPAEFRWCRSTIARRWPLPREAQHSLVAPSSPHHLLPLCAAPDVRLIADTQYTQDHNALSEESTRSLVMMTAKLQPSAACHHREETLKARMSHRTALAGATPAAAACRCGRQRPRVAQWFEQTSMEFFTPLLAGPLGE